jgi:hypothetical protein
MSGASGRTSSITSWRGLKMCGPRPTLHPVFFGSFDWHSCVHGHWLLARLVSTLPGLAGVATRSGAVQRPQFTARENRVASSHTLRIGLQSRGFERPYGWAWALMLAGELARHETEEGRRWSDALKPLADAFVARFNAFLPLATYPVRAGVHSNTAFAMVLALDYAAAANDAHLEQICAEKVRAWYARDADCQAWEPSQDEFLSSALMEAACMRTCLPPGEFRAWFARFLPRAAGRADDPFSPGDRQRSLRRQDRPSRRAQPVARVVLAADRRRAQRRRSAASRLSRRRSILISPARSIMSRATIWANTGSRASLFSRSTLLRIESDSEWIESQNFSMASPRAGHPAATRLRSE